MHFLASISYTILFFICSHVMLACNVEMKHVLKVRVGNHFPAQVSSLFHLDMFKRYSDDLLTWIWCSTVPCFINCSCKSSSMSVRMCWLNICGTITIFSKEELTGLWQFLKVVVGNRVLSTLRAKYSDSKVDVHLNLFEDEY